MRLRPPVDIIRRGLIGGLIGAIVLANVTPAASHLIKGHAAGASSAGIGFIGPSINYNGTEGSGFGSGALAEPTPSPPRALNDLVRPSLGEFCNLRTNSADETIGFQAGFKGKPGSPQGIQKCQVILEGVALDIFNKTSFTYKDPRDQTFNTDITNFLWHFTISAATTFARHAAGGTLRYYLKVYPNDVADAEPFISGPFQFTQKPGLLAAPWGGAATYDAVYSVTNASGPSVDAQMRTAILAGKTSFLIACTADGAYPSTTAEGVGGPNFAKQWTCTIAADPRTVTTGVWMDNTAGSDHAFGWQPGCDGIRFLGKLTVLDPTRLGYNASNGFLYIGTGVDPAINPNSAMCWEGCTWANSGGPGTPSFTGWNGVAGAGVLFNGNGRDIYFIYHGVTRRYVLECNINGIEYGIAGSADAGAFDGVNGTHARNCALNQCFKPHLNVKNSYNCTVTDSGIWNSPNAVPLDAFSIYYSGAGTPTIQSVGADTVATALKLIVNGTPTSLPINSATDILTTLVAAINGVSGWHATLLATTPQVSRNPQYIWYGTQPTTPNSAGIGAGASPFDQPIAVSTSSGSPTVVQTMTDPHVDMIQWQAPDNAVLQNCIYESVSVYGKRGGQSFFVNYNFPTLLDFYISGTEMSDDALVMGAGFVAGSPSSICGVHSNVVFINQTITVAGAGAGQALTYWGSSSSGDSSNYTGHDAYCGNYDSMYEFGTIGAFATMGPTVLSGIATRTNSIIAGGDADCIALGLGLANSSLFVNAMGTAPYGYLGAGVKPNLTPANSNVLKQPISLRIAGSRNLDGTRKAA